MPKNKEYTYHRRSVTHMGKRYEVRGRTATEAAEKLGELKHKLKSGEIGINENMTVSRWAEEWLATYKVGGMTEGSRRTYTEKLNIHILPVIGRMRIGEVRDIHLQKILNAQAGMSFSHVTKIRMVMAQMFKQARISRLIPYDPAEALVLPKNEKRKRRAITDEERYAILRVAEEHRYGLPVLVMLYCGLRPGELPPLTWEDVELTTGFLAVDKAYERLTGTVKSPKTAAGVREVPIPAPLLHRLLQVPQAKRSGLLLPATSGAMMDMDYIGRAWRSFRKSVNLELGAGMDNLQRITSTVVAPDLTQYCLRHTYCTDLESAGIALNVAKYLMGHSDISMTANIYTHTSKSTLQEAAAKLDSRNDVREKLKHG